MKYRKFGRVLLVLLLVCALSWSPNLQAQSGKLADWLTDGGDIERTAWQQNEHMLSTTSVKNMKLLWKTKLDNEPRQMHNLLPVLIVGRVNTSARPKTDRARDRRHRQPLRARRRDGRRCSGNIISRLRGRRRRGGRGAGILCPGGITATPVIGPTEHARQIHRLCCGLGWHACAA